MNKILITGATGQMGRTVLQTLLKKMPASNIHVLSRKAEKLTELQSIGLNTFVGSYEDVTSLAKAMEGVDTVLLISAGDQGDRMQEHRNVVDMAKQCGVQNLAYTSRALRDRTTLHNQLMHDHFNTEDYIQESGLNYTIFQNALYTEFLQFVIHKDHLEKGILLPTGEGRVAFTLRADQAEAIAQVLLNEPFLNKTYLFTGNKTYSFFEVAQSLSLLAGKEIKYTPVELPAFVKTMQQRGLPDAVITKISSFLLDIKNNQETVITHDLENKLGRKPATLPEGLKMVFNF
ncbi:SDR family oxidoreductase [Adhaeribacter pallidiroseus]|uniref:NAD(P)H dehydrogenase (Quinone) n=1 Tax=Adhaeribacter pallidiroseus TaxID=2072847 RepID=A0A369QLV1_9BACT|nr:SDR family oxidoreductase [Adhaeribacter pallidiroseus]RDC63819.1 NAD(P)H dehydrogenase (quinone) [Adhaeribacter pallidiroseus]